jgi:hypothetical protein
MFEDPETSRKERRQKEKNKTTQGGWDGRYDARTRTRTRKRKAEGYSHLAQVSHLDNSRDWACDSDTG